MDTEDFISIRKSAWEMAPCRMMVAPYVWYQKVSQNKIQICIIPLVISTIIPPSQDNGHHTLQARPKVLDDTDAYTCSYL